MVSDEPSIVKVLDDAIDAADKQIEAAQKVLDEEGPGSLAAYIAVVTGTDEDSLKNEDDAAKAVAMAVGGALLPTVPDTADDAATHDGTARRVNYYSTEATLTGATPPAVADRTFNAIDSNGRSWAMIVGESNVMDKRIVVGSATRTGKGQFGRGHDPHLLNLAG